MGLLERIQNRLRYSSFWIKSNYLIILVRKKMKTKPIL